jgi:eukaryotic-like serine/threonine-protein kinase
MTSEPAPQKNDARWERLQELFSRAVDLSPEERRVFIEQETQGEPDLREELAGLLACDMGNATGPLTHALGAALDATSRDRRNAMLGQVVGNYKIVSVLGQGGTGTVYLGERADRQYSAQVAIKVVDNAMMHGDLGMRFRAERQILASLNHANIARLVDAGETEQGQPYLVMEFVHGEPVDRYCDAQRLDVRQRLDLFLKICAAVQYAHQNLVVHRDLKPANILVAVDGEPKLLDFGIAKLLDASSAAASLALTRMNDRLLTPEYASPEQILGRPVTTASDVYALGVVLYELLTGLRPYVVPASASQLELERSICVTDPNRPSASVRRAVEAGAVEGRSTIQAIALARGGLAPDRLERRLIGDIDAIVMRALRKEPEHRYGSVEQFASDIRRYLSNEPVVARQGNWVYYSQRFMRRHAFGVGATAVFTLFAVTVAISMTLQARRIADERDRATQEGERAEKVSNFMLNVFAHAEPFHEFGKEVTARQLLDQAARNIQSDLREQPEVRARLLEAIGRAYRRQSQPEHAIAYLEDAVRLRKEVGSKDATGTGSALAELAVALRQVGRLVDADRVSREAMEVSRETNGERTIGHARLLVDLGRLEQYQGRPVEAERYFAAGLNLTRELLGSRDPEVAAILSGISNTRSWLGDLDGAERTAREAVSIYRETVPEYHPDRVFADYRLANVLELRGLIEDAGVLYESVLNARRVLYGDVSAPVADTLQSLARLRLAQNRLPEAEKLAREGLAINREAQTKTQFKNGYLKTSLARILMKQGKHSEAESELRQALDVFSKELPSDHQYVASAEYVLGEVLLAQGRIIDAEAILTASMHRWRRTDAPEWRAARSASALGEALERQGRTQDAEKYFVDGFRVLVADSGAEREAVDSARERITRFYLNAGRRDKLDALLREANPNAIAAKNGGAK